MRVLQVSNLVSHHQIPLAREIAKIVGENNFRFAATEAPDPGRLKMGWNDAFSDPWILRVGEREEDRKIFEDWWNKADVVICGERRFLRMEERLSNGKLCFYMAERWWKPPIGKARMLLPRFMTMVRQFRRISDDPLFHFLAIGPYSEKDISFLAVMEGRIWRWGYFPEVIGESGPRRELGEQVKVLWAGRMLDWKRVDTLIRAVSHAVNCGSALKLTLIGDGPERRRLGNLADRLLDRQTIAFHGSVPAKEIPELMREHDIYVLPSSAYEGWGAVVNEAMSCGCAVIASEATGAGAAVIKSGINGYLFTSGDWRQLSSRIQLLAGNEVLRRNIGCEAIRSISDIWSPKAAASRLLNVAEQLLSGAGVEAYNEGPMSQSVRKY